MQQRGEEARVLDAPRLPSRPILKNGALTMITLVSDSVKGTTRFSLGSVPRNRGRIYSVLANFAYISS